MPFPTRRGAAPSIWYPPMSAALMLANRSDIPNTVTVSASGTGAVTIGADSSGFGLNAATYTGLVTLQRPTTFSSRVPGDRLAFEFRRTASRLAEMQSREYLAREHRG